MSARLGLAARFARRELRGGLSAFRVFLACLTLGIAALAAVGIVRTAIQAGLAAEGRAILGGDVQITATYRGATEAERAWIEGTAQRLSEIVDFRSMLTTEGPDGTERALTQAKAVDGAYPMVGAVTLERRWPPSPAHAGRRDRSCLCRGFDRLSCHVRRRAG